MKAASGGLPNCIKAEIFNGVRIDPEVGTLVGPYGADFDPATLHDWCEQAFLELAGRWQPAAT